VSAISSTIMPKLCRWNGATNRKMCRLL